MQRTRSQVRLAGIAGVLLAATCGAPDPQVSDVAVEVRQVAFDPVSQSPVVILEETEGDRQLPIWIGVAEAQSIAQRLEAVELPRPNTHDLAKRLVEGLKGAVERVTVTELREGTYYAVIALRTAGDDVDIDARPSDAIALALRMAAPVFVREPLFESAHEGGGEEHPGQRTRAPGSGPATAGAERGSRLAIVAVPPPSEAASF
jgi:bifunctional DNase/RNase